MSIQCKLLQPTDQHLLSNIAPDVFDDPVNPNLTQEFLHDPRHHLAVALDDSRIVAIASAVHYVHPDKPPQLFINEVGVTPSHRNQGLAKKLLALLFEKAQTLGCTEAWV